MAKFNNRIVCRWRDISNRFEGVSAQQHAHEAFAFISNILTRSADIFPKGDRRSSKWDECCQSLLEINGETHKAAIREKDYVPSLRKLSKLSNMKVIGCTSCSTPLRMTAREK